jgi:hypothetical protein
MIAMADLEPDYPEHAPRLPVYGDGDDLDRKPACLDHPMRDEWWFPDVTAPGGWAAARAAAAICSRCPVFIECGEFAEHLRPTSGVWAGRLWGASAPRPFIGVPRLRHLLPDPDDTFDPRHDPPKVRDEEEWPEE